MSQQTHTSSSRALRPQPTQAVIACALLASTLLGQQEKLIAKRDAKLAKPVFAQADWQLDYDAVREEANRSGKLIFAYFTRSFAY